MKNLIKEREVQKENNATEILNATEQKNKTENTKKIHINKKIIANILVVVIIYLLNLIVLTVDYVYSVTGNLSVDQLIFHLKVPVNGTNMDIIWDYIKSVIPCSIILSILVIEAVIIIANFFFKEKVKINKIVKTMTLTLYIYAALTYVSEQADVKGFAKNQLEPSVFIQTNYADTKNIAIEFPKQKRNLIYIYLESMESSYTSSENGGIYKDDYIKELRELAQNNINFSNTEKLGGAYQLPGTNWTIAGMVAQTSGMPLKITIEQNSYGLYNSFLPGVKSLGEVLEENGYKNYLYLGSEVSFGGRENYFSQHGNYEMWDLNSAIREEKMTEEDKVWWGFDDNDLIGYSKQKLLEISQNENPFNFTMLTVDTHFVDGYVCDECRDDFDTQYANVIACSSRQISNFIKWIQEQEFYENTTIIVSGDHLTMQASVEDDAKVYDEDYKRTVFNMVINPNIENIDYSTTKNRSFSTIDMFPTTLAALGATIDGNRLGLGTNLFSGKETLIEENGLDYVTQEFEKKSSFYNNKFIFGK